MVNTLNAEARFLAPKLVSVIASFRVGKYADNSREGDFDPSDARNLRQFQSQKIAMIPRASFLACSAFAPQDMAANSPLVTPPTHQTIRRKS